jgi:hypothetical protein
MLSSLLPVRALIKLPKDAEFGSAPEFAPGPEEEEEEEDELAVVCGGRDEEGEEEVSV